jgi:hypothetical protein
MVTKSKFGIDYTKQVGFINSYTVYDKDNLYQCSLADFKMNKKIINRTNDIVIIDELFSSSVLYLDI